MPKEGTRSRALSALSGDLVSISRYRMDRHNAMVMLDRHNVVSLLHAILSRLDSGPGPVTLTCPQDLFDALAYGMEDDFLRQRYKAKVTSRHRFSLTESGPRARSRKRTAVIGLASHFLLDVQDLSIPKEYILLIRLLSQEAGRVSLHRRSLKRTVTIDDSDQIMFAIGHIEALVTLVRLYTFVTAYCADVGFQGSRGWV